MRDIQRKRDWKSLRQAVGGFIKNDFRSMLDIVPVPRDSTPPNSKPNTIAQPSSKTSSSPRTANLRKAKSEAVLRGRNFAFTSPGLDNFGDHRDHASWAFSSASSASHRRPSTTNSSIDSQDSLSGIISNRTRSSVSTVMETLHTPAQSTRDLNPSIRTANEDEYVNILCTRSEARSLSAEDVETLAWIRAAYPDPNQRSFTTPSTIRRSLSTSGNNNYQPTPLPSNPSPKPTKFIESEDWMSMPTESVYELPEEDRARLERDVWAWGSRLAEG